MEIQEQMDDVTTFGSYVTSPNPVVNRTDIENTRLLFTAILDQLHLALSTVENSPVSGMLLQNAINQTLTAQLWTEKALHYADEIVFDDESNSEPDNVK